MKSLRALAAAAAALALLAGCDVIFTASPLSFLQRDPDDMTPEQRTRFAEDALASGDPDAIETAYDAIKDDAAASTDGDLQLLAAQLALELAGIGDVLDDLVNLDFEGDWAANRDCINGLIDGMNGAYLGESAGFYLQADGNGGDLAGADYILGALAILADSAIVDGAGDVDNLDSSSPGVVDAIAFLTSGQSALGADDASYELITSFLGFLNDTSNFP